MDGARGAGIMPRGFHTQWGARTSGGGLGKLGDTDAGVVASPLVPFGDVSTLDARAVYDAHASQPLAGDKHINVALSIDLAVSANRITVCAFRMPAAYQGMIRYVANSTAGLSDLVNVRWSILLNDSDVPGFSNFIGQLAPGPYVPLPVRIDLNPNDRIAILATDIGGGGVSTVTGRLYGWAWAMNVGGLGGGV